jgi:hypothetical protein
MNLPPIWLIDYWPSEHEGRYMMLVKVGKHEHEMDLFSEGGLQLFTIRAQGYKAFCDYVAMFYRIVNEHRRLPYAPDHESARLLSEQ